MYAIINTIQKELCPEVIEFCRDGYHRMSKDQTIYHNNTHVVSMYIDLHDAYNKPENREYFEKEISEDIRDLTLAICWHDVVSMPGYQYNEVVSANKWQKYAKTQNIPHHIATNVYDMIVSTKVGTSREYLACRPEFALLHDLDYMSFSDYSIMVANREKLRKEFEFLDFATYCEGKVRFLSWLLGEAEQGLFLTPIFQHLNEVTLENVKREYRYYNEHRNAFISNHTLQQHDDITLDYFSRLMLITEDQSPEKQYQMFSEIVDGIKKRMEQQQKSFEEYPSIRESIDKVLTASEEDRTMVLAKQIASAIKRIESYQELMDSLDDDRETIIKED